MQGTVDRVVADEGFGFIIGPNGEEYFFHRTGLKGVEWEELGPGVPVIFQATAGEGDRPDWRDGVGQVHGGPAPRRAGGDRARRRPHHP
ncbi:MAG: cold shock domain-containing protein [Actinobacteria bacterium]|nr:cold shock domain-containing protein [Actinomycetota bacterium]